MHPKRAPIATAAGILVLAAAAPAFAQGNDGERGDAGASAATATVPLGQAISAAESATGGRAVRAGYESQDGAPIVQVDLVKDNALIETSVDPATGKVIATGKPDGEEHEGDEEGEDG